MDSHLLLRRGVPALAACAALLAAAPAQAKTPLPEAENKALEALKVNEGTDSVLVFRNKSPLEAGTVIRQAGTAKPVRTRANTRGVRRTTAPVALRVPDNEPAWFFYSDEGPFQAYQHPGRVVLVGVESGKVRVSDTLQWPPVIAGRLPVFMRSAPAYRDPSNRIFYRLYDAKGIESSGRRGGRASSRSLGDDEFAAASQSADEMALRQRAADQLAEEGSCVVRFGETLGNFYDFAALSKTVVGFGGLFNGLERLNTGFRSSRYGLRSGLSPLAYVQRAIDRGNCRDVLLYMAGSGYKGREVVNFGLRPRKGGKVDVQELSAAQLRRLTRRNDGVTFKLIADAPYAGDFSDLVATEPNVLIVQTPGRSSQPSFRFIPGILHNGQILRNFGNSMGLLEFTNRLRIGFDRFLSCEGELDRAEAQTASSFLVWTLGRAFQASEGDDFAKKIGLTDPVNVVKPGQQSSAPAGCEQSPPGDVNDPPVATPQSLNAVEDTPRSITLSGTDPDGDTLGFEIVTAPSHGTLTGTAPNVTYTPQANFNGADSFTFRVGDGALTSDPATVSLAIAAANDGPVVTASAGSLAFTENASATAADPGLTVTDIDSSVTGASVKIAEGFASGQDELALPSHPAISGTYNSGTGVLTLTGSAAPGDYQAALRSVTFRHTGDDPTASRRLEFAVTDGALGSVASRNVAITAVNDLPVVDAANGVLAYVEGDGQIPVDPALTLADLDDDQMSGATVQITGNHFVPEDELAFTNASGITGAYDDASGKLTLTGAASRADYQAALRTVTFENGSGSPSTAQRTVTFAVTDASAGTGPSDTRDISVSGANDLATVGTSPGSASFTEDGAAVAIDNGLTVEDSDNAQLQGATAAITSNFQAGDELKFVDGSGITGTYNSGTGVLTLAGAASKSDYQAALRSIEFDTPSQAPSGPKTIQFRADDGNGPGPAATRDVAVNAVNDNPTLGATNTTLSYTEGDGAVAVDNGLTAGDVDSAQLVGATMQITSNLSGGQDALAFVDTASISGSYNAATGTLALTGADTVANYQAALRSVTYENSSDDPATATRTVSFQADDGAGANNLSNVGTRDVSVAAANDAPVVDTAAGSTPFTEGASPVAIASGLTVTDADDSSIESAQVRISSGFQASDDLVFVDQSGITGTYNTGTGVLTLTGTASLSDYQAALRSVEFDTTNRDPVVSKTVEFMVNDGDADSNAATKTIAVTPVNDPPNLTTTVAALSYTEGDGLEAIDTGINVTDPDSTTLAGATVQITGNFLAADDELAFVDTASITGSYNDTTGTLTLTGTDTLANYQTALRSVTYENVSQNPSGTKTVSFQLDDGGAVNNLSGVATRDINLTGANDAPVVTTSAGSTAYSEGDPATAIDGSLTVTDADDTSLESAQVRISADFQTGDELVFVDQSGIAGVYATGTGVLTMTGTASVSDYQAALRSIEYRNTSGSDVAASKTVEYKVNDGAVDSNLATKNIAVTGVNDNSTLTTTVAALSYTEGDGAVAADSGITVADTDSVNLAGATVQITSNHSSGEDSLIFVDQNGISGSYGFATGLLTLSGTASLADYQAALRSVQYQNTSDNPSTLTRTVSFRVDDGGAVDNLSNIATRDITVAPANDAPVVNTSAGSTSYTEGNAGTVVDGALTVSDADDANIESAQVRISANFESGDDLTFVNTVNISGSYNTGTGVLTLTGTDTAANYQAALRSITFDNTVDDNLTSPKTVEFKVNDGDVDSNLATKNIAVTAVNDAPTVNTTGAALSYTEGDGPVAADTGLTLTDPDSTQVQGATVQITGNHVQADDQLAFVDTASITGAYNDTTGTLTLSGTTSLANYQAALRSVTFENVNQNPSGTKTLSFQATDAEGAASNVATRTINLAGANDAPVVTTSAGSTAYSEGDPATAIDGALTVSDADDANVESAQVRISSNFQSGDVLTFVNTVNITGNYTSGTGVLTLTGTDTVANYQAALRSVTFEHTGDNPSSGKVVEFKVNDGDVDSNLATKSINLTGVNDAPTLTTTVADLSYTEGDGAVAVDNGLTASDPDTTQFQGATVQITGGFVQADDELAFTDQNGITGAYNDTTGTLTLSGTTSVANYQTALRSVTYESASNNPSGSKTVSFQATDAGGAASNVATRDINLAGANDAPVVTSSAGATAYTEGDPATTVDGALTVTDVDDANLEGGQVRISSNFQSGDDLVFVNQNGIAGNYNSGTGVLTLTGTSSTANYQTALRSIQYQTTNNNPSTSKTVEFKVNDGDVDSNLATKNLSITPVNDAPTVNTTASALSYTEGDGAVAADPGLTLTDPDSTQMQGATVQITGNHVQAHDELAFADTATITGAYNDTTGTLTLSGNDTVANYQSALRSVTYENVSDNPSGSKTLSFQATDAEGAASNVATRDINLAGANDAPVVTTSAGSTSYTEGGTASTVDGALTVTDADDTNLEAGQVRISSGFQSGDDLVFVNQNGITGNYNSGTGVLTLTGTASKADYQTALRSIQYQTTNDNPVGSKTVEFKAGDGDVDSNLATKEIAVTPANDAPTLTTSAGSAAFVEDSSGPVDVDPSLTLTDPDSTNVQGATVEITTGFNSSEDQLVFANTANITGSYNSGTGVLTLSGSDTVANYQAALRSVEYNNTDTVAPDTTTRTVRFQATDAEGAASNTATRDVTVGSVNDAPVVTTSAGSTPYTEDDPATTVDGSLTVSDQDDTNLEGGQVRISSGFQSGDDLVFVNQNGISGVYNTGTGVLTLTGTATVADYQTGLRSIQFQSTNQQPVTSKTIEFKVNDGDSDSSLATKEMAVTPTNDSPIVTAGGTLSYTENDPATVVHSGMTIDDTENDSISGGSASITSNYAAGQDFLNWIDNNLADNITLDNVNTDQQTIVLTGLDSEANYQAALRAVTYQNGSENPTTSNRTVTFSATDQPGLTGSDTRTISVTAVDDPPTAVNDSATVLEDAAATSIPVLTNDTDADGGPKTISSASDPANGTVVLTGGSPGNHTGLTYQPDPNYCNDPPGTTPDTFTYTLNGGSVATVSMTVTCVNDAPVADDETFNGNDSAHGNTTMQVDDPDDNKSAPTNPHTEITGDILAGDTDIDGPGPMTVTPGTFATNDGGSVTLESDGDFVFQPAAHTSCTDTSDFFDYTVEDSGSPEQTDTGRVTIAIAGCVLYVHNNSPGNSGTSNAPFDTLAQAETASGTNHTVFVFDGENTPTGYDAGGYAMNSGERLIGEHEGLTVDPDQGGALTADSLHPANAGAHPTLTSTGAGLDVIDLDDGNEIRGFNIDPQTGHGGIQGSAGDTGGGTIDDVNIVDTFGTNGTQAGLELNGTTGTFNITNFTVDNNATGVLLNNAGTVDFGGDSGVVTLDSNGAPALSATSTNMGTSNVDDIIATGSSAGGVILSSASGTTNLGDGSGTDLNLTTTSGATPALSIASSGTVTVGSGGTDELHATGGPALDVTGTSGASFDFEDVDSMNSANDGINIDGLGTGIFQAAAGDITGAAGIGFDLNGGSGTILYQGNLNNGGGTTAIDITGRTGGGVTLSGPISDTNDAGGALNLASNTGGSTTISNATKQFNTGTTQAVGFATSDGHTLTLSGGTLDIDTTSGAGLNASTSGTLEVSGSGNTIDTTTGRALNVENTDIATNDLTFQRISSNGASNGIRLNNTANSLGRLFVQGNAGTCSSAATCTGGAIQNSTGAGVELTSAPGGASLTRLAVTAGGDDGIRATTVGTTGGTGLDLANSFLSANGNAVGERGLDADNVIGTSSITSSTITQSSEDNARWENDNGTLGLTVTGSTFSSNSAVNGADGMLLRGDATAIMTANITTSTFQHNRDDGFQAAMASPNTAQMNVTFTGNDVFQGVNNAPNNAAMHISNGSAGDMKFKMTDNDLSGSLGSTLILNPGPDGTSASSFDAIVTNNRIGTGTVDSGSVSGIGLWGRAAGNGVNRFEIRDNTIRNYQQQGMYLRGNEGVGQVTDYTVTGNTVTNPDGTGFRILLEAGSSAGDSTDVCVDFGGGNNTVSSGGSPADIGVARDFNASTLTLRNYGGGDLSTYFNGRNTGTPGALTAILSNLTPAGNAAACALPSTPPLP